MSIREDCGKRWEALKSERTSWLPHWKEISEVLLPRSGRFLPTDQNNGAKRHRAILDNSGTRALRTLTGGMMAGMSSPARQWFRLTTSEPTLDENPDVKKWLGDVTTIMQLVFQRSNVYRALQTSYEELGAFGTSATILLDDFDNVIHCMPLTIGEYAIATDARGTVDTLYREFRMTVSSLVQEFGYGNVSEHVKKLFNDKEYDKWVTVVNAIEPRYKRDVTKKDAKNMPWRSVYFEARGGGEKLLRESGFKRFPALCARWNVTGGDIYGTSPGMEALGDLRQLQQQQYYKSKAIAMQADPPMVAPTDMRDQEASLIPGGIVYADNAGSTGLVRSAVDVKLDITALLADIQDVRQRIDAAFYKDIFLMIGQSQNSRMTATEIAERHEEKMLMLGPVLERLNAELGAPLVKGTFERMAEVGLLPKMPQVLNQIDLNVEFVSILAQAQRAVVTNGIDRFTQNLGTLIAIKPELADKFNADYWADYYADALGIDPQLVVGAKDVALIRQQRAQAQQAQMQQVEAQAQADVNLKNAKAAQAQSQAQGGVMPSPLAQAQALQGGLAPSDPMMGGL